MPEGVLALQRQLVDAALAPASAAPEHAIYREMIRLSLEAPLEAMFPVLRSLLQDANAWPEAVAQFLAARRIASPHYRDVAPAFLGWLADTGWGQERWPFLLELAHFEWLQSAVELHPDSPVPRRLHATPSPGDRVVLDPASQVVAYRHAVSEATPARPEPPARPQQLLAYRDAEGEVRWLELTATTAALLQRAQQDSIQEAVTALGAGLSQALALLMDFQAQGAIAGFR